MHRLEYDFIGGFYEMVFPCIDVLDKLYWMMDAEAGVIDSTWIYDHEDIYWKHVYKLNQESCSDLHVFIPRTLTSFRKAIILDEDSYYLGFDESSKTDMDYIISNWNQITEFDFFKTIKMHNMMLFIHRYYYRWELFSSEIKVIERLKRNVAVIKEDIEWSFHPHTLF